MRPFHGRNQATIEFAEDAIKRLMVLKHGPGSDNPWYYDDGELDKLIAGYWSLKGTVEYYERVINSMEVQKEKPNVKGTD